MAKTILIVDDSASFRQVVAITLKSAGYDVIEGCDGKDALEKIADKRVHLIISDVNMPNMDGITFLRQVKLHPRHKFIPVIMLTTETEQARMQQAKAAGARAWLVKPFHPPALLDAVSQLAAA